MSCSVARGCGFAWFFESLCGFVDCRWLVTYQRSKVYTTHALNLSIIQTAAGVGRDTAGANSLSISQSFSQRAFVWRFLQHTDGAWA